jgi:hypothetical protein
MPFAPGSSAAEDCKPAIPMAKTFSSSTLVQG